MNIRERVLAQLKTSYAKYGFKKEELNQITDIIALNLTDESSDEDISHAVKNSEGYAQMMQSVYNRGVTETNAKYKGYVKPTPVEPEPKEPANEPILPKQVTSEEIKKMIQEQMKANQKAVDEAVKAALQPFVQREEKVRLNTLLHNHEKVKQIPDVFTNNYVLDDEEKLEDVAARIESDWVKTKQALMASGQFVEAPPKADPQSETDDFVKQMQGFSERNGAKKE